MSGTEPEKDLTEDEKVAAVSALADAHDDARLALLGVNHLEDALMDALRARYGMSSRMLRFDQVRFVRISTSSSAYSLVSPVNGTAIWAAKSWQRAALVK